MENLEDIIGIGVILIGIIALLMPRTPQDDREENDNVWIQYDDEENRSESKEEIRPKALPDLSVSRPGTGVKPATVPQRPEQQGVRGTVGQRKKVPYVRREPTKK